LRPLQPQHQLNQLFLAQTFKIAAAHTSRESANPSWRKGLGNYTAKYWQPPGSEDGCDKPRREVRAADMKWFSMPKPSVIGDTSVSACRTAVMEDDLVRRRSLFETLRGSSLRIVTIR
ncbi:hypothetical protein, partial [Microvirga tunisiensis]|uniref:hypothetical protein n=1 Tax=Microvirga tunisiensis TaxID=2108360 RepID=UPI001AEEFB1D